MSRSILVALLGLTACTSRVRQASPDQVLGCYVLGWPGGIPQLAAPFPDTIRLESAELVDPWTTVNRHVLGRRVEVVGDTQRFHGVFWWNVENDSITIVKSDGYSGEVVRLVRKGDGVSGLGHAFSDVVVENAPPAPTYPVVGQRIECAR